MKLVLLLPLLSVVSLAETEYDDINKTSDIDILSYGTQAAKDIRAIGRSYAYQLIKKEQFTDYVGNAVEIMDNKTLDEMEKAKKYAEEYTVHVAVVGAGIIIAILLGLGFCLTPICCCCCNNSQKQDSGMAMWRMIWGTILVILLAANIAGLAILVVSGQQVLTLEDDTTGTIDSLGDGFIKYFDETDNQLEAIKTNQIKVFIKQIEPLFNVAIEGTIAEVKADTTLNTGVTNTVDALTNLDTQLGDARTNVETLSGNVTDLTGTLTAINGNLATCKTAVDNCDAANANACSNQGVTPSMFTTSFDPSIMKASEIDTVKENINKLASFPPGADGKTLTEWAAFVRQQWDDMSTTITNNAQIKSAMEAYTTVLKEAETQFSTELDTKVQSELKKLKDTIKTQKTDVNAQLKAHLAYIKDLMLLKEGNTTNVSETIVDFTEEGVGKYAPFALFVLICVILGLLVLTVLVGLLATVFGCCKVSDDVLPTERDSGACGNLLMCTSYCSVILCAIACLVAAVLVTVVIATEGTCKQYNDNKLIGELKGMGEKLNMNLDIGKMLADAMKLEDETVNIQEVLDDCFDNKTFFTAFKFQQDTVLLGTFSFNSLKDEVDKQINGFDVTTSLGDTFNVKPDLIDADAKADIEKNKGSLNAYNYVDIRNTIDSTKTTSIGTPAEISALSKKIDDLPAGLNMADCKTAVDNINSQIATVDTQKTALLNSLDKMKITADKAVVEVDNLVTALTAIDDRLDSTKSGAEFDIKDIVVKQADDIKKTAISKVKEFIDWLFGEFQNNIASCQPVAAVYYTVLNYTCDGILIHLTLLYCGMSLVGISLLFYMCVARCLARYFIRYNHLHPEDEGGNGWTKDHSMTPVLGSGNRVGPYPGHYAQTKL